MRSGIAALLSIAALAAQAESWTWSQKFAIDTPPTEGVFHHLDGSGRKHIAVSAERIAVTWEDDSNGPPQVYLSDKSVDQPRYNQPMQLSQGSEAYEPAIAALADNSFITAYEEDGAVYARLLSTAGLSAAVKLSTSKADHAGNASITGYGDNAYVIWREEFQNQYRLLVRGLELEENNQLEVGEVFRVEAKALQYPVLKPAISATPAVISVAWEDRRAGHTRLMYSYAPLPDIQFSPPEYLNEYFSDRNQYDKGSGVTRVAMATFGEDEVLAAWMDKRRRGTGYGIFASLGYDGGATFGPNEKVHGDNGDKEPHHNPTAAGNAAGDLIIAWDDFRNGDLDIWLSDYTDEAWSEDLVATPAAGPGEQSHASIALDEQGRLHLVWIERAQPASPTRLWYSFAVRN